MSKMKKYCITMVVVTIMIAFAIFPLCSCKKTKLHEDKEGIGNEVGQKQEIESSKGLAGKNLPKELSNPNITVVVWGAGAIDLAAEGTKLFEEKYGGKVEYIITGNAEGDINTKIVAAINAGSPYDVIRWQNRNMPAYAMKGFLQPIDDYIDITDPVWTDGLDTMDQFKYQGKYYGVTGDTGNAFFIYFNKTLFENSGLKTPKEYYNEGKWNWETFSNVGMALTIDTDKDGAIDQWGFDTNEYRNLITVNNADFVNIKEDGSIELTALDSKVIEALQFIQDGMFKHQYMANSNKRDELWITGKLGMMSRRADFGYDPKIKENVKFEWDIVPLPAGPSGTVGVSPATCAFQGIGNGSKNPQGAATYIYFRQKALNEQGDQNLVDNYTPEQVELIKKINGRVRIAKFYSIGDMQKLVNQLIKKLANGPTVVSTVEENIPLLQAEIDALLASK